MLGTGYYLWDEISSYIIVLGVKAGYQHIYMCMYLSSETRAYSMSNLGMQAVTIWVTSIHGLK